MMRVLSESCEDKDKPLIACRIHRDFAAQVVIRAKDGKAVKHDGIKVEFVGSIGI